MPPKTKTAFQLDSPYAEPAWPSISAQDQDTIVELLANLLSPIGVHRKAHTKPSQGKRKRKASKKDPSKEDQRPLTPPEAPPISAQVLVGLNSVTRHLSSSSVASCPTTFLHPASINAPDKQLVPITSPNSKSELATLTGKEVPASEHEEKKLKPAAHMSVLFTTRQPTPPLSSHLPMLAHTASLAHSSLPATRLVVLPQKAEARICEALGIARAGLIALLEGDNDSTVVGMRALVEFVREKVPKVEVGNWLYEGVKEYRETRINAVQVAVPVTQKEKKK